MFNIKSVIGWIGNMAVVPADNGVYLVEWATGKRTFVPKTIESEDEG